MASIGISELHPAGSELFSDSETFMTDLADNELSDISGGGTQAIGAATLGFIGGSTPGCGVVISAIVSGVVAYTVLHD
jgi:hypothetical protein